MQAEGEPRLQESALLIFAQLARHLMSTLRQYLGTLHEVLSRALASRHRDVALAAMRATAAFVQVLPDLAPAWLCADPCRASHALLRFPFCQQPALCQPLLMHSPSVHGAHCTAGAPRPRQGRSQQQIPGEKLLSTPQVQVKCVRVVD